MRLCKDCKYFVPYVSGYPLSSDIEFAECHHPRLSTVSPVDGSVTGVLCKSARILGGGCGTDGTLWEPAPAPEPTAEEKPESLGVKIFHFLTGAKE